MMQYWILVCSLASVLLAPSMARAFDVPAIAGDPRERRVDLFDRDRTRAGYVVISPHGRIDVYDRRSNHTGSGRISKDGNTIELFDLRGNRMGNARVAR